VSDERFMSVALALGRRGLGECWPNPSVGCVIVKDGRIVGRGRTAASGRPHAEAEALAQAGEAARGATVYVSLEPCAHPGRDESCSDKLIRAGVARVVAAVQDPFPHVDGQGFDKLRAAGISCDNNCLKAEAEEDHAGFFLKVRQGRPLVTLKLAMSLDGRIATASGESKWITGPEARARVHLMRASHDAVMVGGGTVRDDDPELTVRGLGITRQPVRVVLSTKALPVGSKLVATAKQVPVWLCHTGLPPVDEGAMKAAGVRLFTCQSLNGRVDIRDALKHLGQAGLTRVFCEGGGELASSLLAAKRADRLVSFTAGLTLGATGKAGIGALPHAKLADFPRYRLTRTERIGADALSYWTSA
jgi:diaminohydroxyphosphoribosylaminopyrimidine deaminase / 5-amino-6-(5-phosphoribosylamino)uracil reductase